jgi:hypothetical protein
MKTSFSSNPGEAHHLRHRTFSVALSATLRSRFLWLVPSCVSLLDFQAAEFYCELRIFLCRTLRATQQQECRTVRNHWCTRRMQAARGEAEWWQYSMCERLIADSCFVGVSSIRISSDVICRFACHPCNYSGFLRTHFCASDSQLMRSRTSCVSLLLRLVACRR